MSAAAGRSPPRTVGEIDSFIAMLLAACESRKVNDHLEKLLAMPDEARRATVHAWVNDLLIAQAPREFTQAIACLLDDRVAEKAYEVIYRCQRPEDLGVRRNWRRFAGAVRRFARMIWPVAPLLAVPLVVALGMWLFWPAPPPKPLVEMEPAKSFRARSPAIKAYEDLWWAAVLKNLGALCSKLDALPAADHFVMYVGSDGGLIRIDIRPYYHAEVDGALRSIALPAFTPEQKAEKKTLALRGYFNAQEEKCYAQRT